MQVIIGAGIASLVSLGVMQMLENSKIHQRRITTLATLTELKKSIENGIRDQIIWSQSINYAGNSDTIFANLRGNLAVTEVGYGSPRKFIMVDASGIELMNLVDPSATTGTFNGFTEKGGPCTTFNIASGQGVDACPISYKIMIAADCPGAATSCTEPQLKIVGRLFYNPSTKSSSVLNRFRNLIAQTVSGTYNSNINNNIVDGKYDAVVKRTPSSIGRSFKISTYFNFTAGANTCALKGVATCTTTPTVHPSTVSSGWTEDYDPHNLVTAQGAGLNGRFNFNETGYYGCSVTLPVFATSGASIWLRNVTTGVSVGVTTTVAPPYSESLGRIDTSFYLASTTNNFEVWQRCDSAAMAQCSLGFVKEPYTVAPMSVVSVICSKLDQAF